MLGYTRLLRNTRRNVNGDTVKGRCAKCSRWNV